uniref:Uncharacterized protein n=1 Tax=Romanomermis culicivorax TaxID=13658 RepID=A0A915JW61_ROMCU
MRRKKIRTVPVSTENDDRQMLSTPNKIGQSPTNYNFVQKSIGTRMVRKDTKFFESRKLSVSFKSVKHLFYLFVKKGHCSFGTGPHGAAAGHTARISSVNGEQYFFRTKNR